MGDCFLSEKPKVSFIVTALNEEVRLEATINEIYKSVDGLVDEFEVVMVNDGSTDKTGEIMERLAAADARLRVIHNPKNLNLGGAFKRGLQDVKLDYIMWLPGDNGAPAPTVRPVLEKVGQADIVVPYLADPRNRSLPRRFVSRSYTLLLNTLFGLKLRYYNGIVVHRRDLLQSIEISTNSFACFAEALIKLLRRGSSYVEVGYISTERPAEAGRSSAFRLKNVVNVVKTIWYLYATCVLFNKTPKKAPIKIEFVPVAAGQPGSAAPDRK